MIGQPLGNRWRAAQRFVNAAEIIVGDVQLHGGGVIVEFLGKAIGEPREAAAGHPH
jgi:hypothetical protein